MVENLLKEKKFRLEHEKQRQFSCTITILRLICLPPIKDFLVSSIGCLELNRRFWILFDQKDFKYNTLCLI
ncbi:hypothetical protein CMV_009729 [Castanea mollissima]|uniref:Uncharacterized protein n=1 Tax=Castanea mollissima TaxID=60419 RepID=A0A8J4W195_9ROSI|nr:hypothetical protein CMV_009729 [Castanea mollissima]